MAVLAIESAPSLVPLVTGLHGKVYHLIAKEILADLWQFFEFEIRNRFCAAA
jgi:hypothetical protein